VHLLELSILMMLLMMSYIMLRMKVDRNGDHFIVAFTPFKFHVPWALPTLITFFLESTTTTSFSS
jgi:hypothetical protein